MKSIISVKLTFFFYYRILVKLTLCQLNGYSMHATMIRLHLNFLVLVLVFLFFIFYFLFFILFIYLSFN